ncbi:FAD-dependent oxidoreductase [Roseovarius halotolerans]|uniref:Dihydrolipoyl dehydrogenase n=1 Tax=Roseovarius halotolerans TaxID=505353 RepID=A0A1X6ZSD6_9RHOB|nr:FAD-dependent oxidoreductase [Roseovarius halotolerans]SLN59873.1 Dihydrolipoyl dehydrogenase [Roseovarius halotolerans]
MSVEPRRVDVAVLGAGTAGLAAERHARRNGARTLLIDPDFAGTTCATVGCMPSKLLIAAAEAADGVRRAGEFGISAEPHVDGRACAACAMISPKAFGRISQRCPTAPASGPVPVSRRPVFWR